MSQNAIPDRIAAATMAKRGAVYSDEVRRLLDAALEVISRTSAPRVADIVAAAGLSNDAFYRHFRSKDALIAAVIEDGTERLAAYIEHQMGKESEPAAQVRRWVEAVMSQARADIAGPTLAVVGNGNQTAGEGYHGAAPRLAQLLVGPVSALGCSAPELAASLAAHAVVGRMSQYLWAGEVPSSEELDQIAEFVLRAL